MDLEGTTFLFTCFFLLLPPSPSPLLLFFLLFFFFFLCGVRGEGEWNIMNSGGGIFQAAFDGSLEVLRRLLTANPEAISSVDEVITSQHCCCCCCSCYYY